MIQRTRLFTRHSSVVDLDKVESTPITLVGVGAVGSIVAITLAKLGFATFHLYDHDKVEGHNVANQFYGISDIGQYKADAIAKYLKDYGAKEVICHNHKFVRFNDKKDITPIVICGADGMKTRQSMALHIQTCDIPLYIETRMGLQSYSIYILTPNKVIWSKYLSERLSSENLEEARCTEKSIMFTPMGVAEKVGKIIIEFIKGTPLNVWCYTYDIKDLVKNGGTSLYETIEEEKIENVEF